MAGVFYYTFKRKTMERNSFINQMRGETLGIVSDSSSSEEKFQNQTLRPILKLQNDLFLAVFANHLEKNKKDFDAISVEKKLAFIDSAIQKDIKFRNSLKGMVIAFFTIEEYSTYITNSSNLNKRMMNMVSERLKSQLLLFSEV